MIPDYQTLMRPVLESAQEGEVRIGEVVDRLADRLDLSEEERNELLPSGQARFANRVHWAKGYLKQAGLVEPTKRGSFIITERGKQALADVGATINYAYLEQFEEFKEFLMRHRAAPETGPNDAMTPDERLRHAYKQINDDLSEELLDRVRKGSPEFFENLIVELLLAMGYGGTEDSGRRLGKSGDDGVDGVIEQDALGVDQIYLQAKRYAADKTIGPDAIRDFFGALNLKKAQKGIFVTTSLFSEAARSTAENLTSRIVLIDGLKLASLMIRYNTGCRDEEVLYRKKIDEDFFGQE
ncbi:MAG: restriction endonuclease [Chloroflexi bacterium]|nr:restriction endonuclease [Chloroflexota bacterium]